MRFLGLSFLLLLSGCVQPTNNSFVGPTGVDTFNTKCSQSPQACFQSAAQQCSGSYAVVDSHSNAGGFLADVIPGPVTWYNMTYICGRSNGVHPAFLFRGQQYIPPNPPSITNCQRYGNNVICQSY